MVGGQPTLSRLVVLDATPFMYLNDQATNPIGSLREGSRDRRGQVLRELVNFLSFNGNHIHSLRQLRIHWLIKTDRIMQA